MICWNQVLKLLRVFNSNVIVWVTQLSRKHRFSAMGIDKLYCCLTKRMDTHGEYSYGDHMSVEYGSCFWRRLFPRLLITICSGPHHLVDLHFTTPKDVDKIITDFIDSKSPSYYKDEIRQLPNRCQNRLIEFI